MKKSTFVKQTIKAAAPHLNWTAGAIGSILITIGGVAMAKDGETKKERRDGVLCAMVGATSLAAVAYTSLKAADAICSETQHMSVEDAEREFGTYVYNRMAGNKEDK